MVPMKSALFCNITLCNKCYIGRVTSVTFPVPERVQKGGQIGGNGRSLLALKACGQMLEWVWGKIGFATAVIPHLFVRQSVY